MALDIQTHDEPQCLGYNQCTYREPHKHGFDCNKACNECWGQCHPNCPANASHYEGDKKMTEEATRPMTPDELERVGYPRNFHEMPMNEQLASIKLLTENQNLWEKPWRPVVNDDEELTLQTIIGQALGSASVAWSNPPSGVFNSEMADWIMGGAINEIEKLVWQQSQKMVLDDAHQVEDDCCVQAEDGPMLDPEYEEQWKLRRADKADLVDLILHYKNPADDNAKLRQIKIVME